MLTFECNNGLQINWHAGEPLPVIKGTVCGQPVRVLAIHADGDELKLLLALLAKDANRGVPA